MDLSPELVARLYSASPDDFLSVRSTLAGQAKIAGDGDLARLVTAQRKPTVGAWIVNRHVHEAPEGVERLVELGARLRQAHEELDAATLRDLSTERRQVVTELTDAALAGADRADASTSLRDDVTATFDAAVADPRIAAQLGRLTRPQHWSGFGVATDVPPGAPELTVIRGGRDRPSSSTTGGQGRRASGRQNASAGGAGSGTEADAGSQGKDSPTEDGRPETTRPDAAARRRAKRVREKAQQAFTTADEALRDTEQAALDAETRVRDLSAQVSRLQAELDTAKSDVDRFRREIRSARNRRREARSALDRAERQAGSPT